MDEPACWNKDHPGYGMLAHECERKVRRIERGGGAGQWLLSVQADHRAAQEGGDALCPGC